MTPEVASVRAHALTAALAIVVTIWALAQCPNLRAVLFNHSPLQMRALQYDTH